MSRNMIQGNDITSSTDEQSYRAVSNNGPSTYQCRRCDKIFKSYTDYLVCYSCHRDQDSTSYRVRRRFQNELDESFRRSS